MAQAPITKRSVDAAHPRSTEYVVWDHGGKETVKGFGLKVTPAGSKVYIYQYRISRPGTAAQTTPRKYTIGRHGDLTPDQARQRARELASMVASGIDPRQRELEDLAELDAARREAAERKRIEDELSFENVAKRWLADYEVGHRPRSFGQAKLVVDKHLTPALRGKTISSIKRSDIQKIIDGIPARQLATRRTVYAYASIFFGWALQRGDIIDNPVLAMAKPLPPKARDRVLSDDELAVVWAAVNELQPPLASFYRLLILTGQRREEVARMDWSELDRSSASWVIPAARAKNGIAHIVPLAPPVIEELDGIALARQLKENADVVDAKRWPKAGPVNSNRGSLPIGGFSQAKRLLDDEIAKARKDEQPIAPWRVHDLRRTMATGFQRLGVRFEVTEAVLNHVSGSRSGVAGVYQRHDWAAEKRSALEAWARHVETIAKPDESSNVIAIKVTQRSA